MGKGEKYSKVVFYGTIMAKLKDNRKSTPQTNQQISGRPPLSESEKRSHYYNFLLNEEEAIKFKKLLAESGAKTQTEFIKNCIFNLPFQDIKRDASAMDIYFQLRGINSQVCMIGIKYNQVLQSILSTFTEGKALISLRQLERAMIQISTQLDQVIKIIRVYEKKFLSGKTNE